MIKSRVGGMLLFILVAMPFGAVAQTGSSPLGETQEQLCNSVYVDPHHPASSRVIDETIEDADEQHPFTVLLPADYSQTDARYPVLYLLHGWTMNESSWLDFTDIVDFTASFTAGHGAAIVVMPAVRGLGFDVDSRDGPRKWETVVTTILIPYIDAHYRTLADRRHRALAGLSGGGISSMIYAGHRPDLFAAAGAFSGALDLANHPPIGSVATWLIDQGSNTCAGGLPTDQGAAGNPLTDEVWYRDLNPIDLAANTLGTDLYVASGSVPCDAQDLRDIAHPVSRSPGAIVYQPLEVAIYVGSLDASQKLAAGGASVTTDFGCGIHSWRYWERDVHRFWDFMFASFAKLEPETFDHKRAIPRFSAFGWTFEADPERAPEFLNVTGASCSGVGLSGSGTTTVTTAPCFAPGQIVTLTGGIEPNASADSAGRITFHVDLGPAHRFQQYTALQRAVEALGGYWTSRTITLN